jgi:hypothetical protein
MKRRTMLGHPGLQTMVVILLIGKDREETWKLLRRDETQYERSSSQGDRILNLQQ